MLIYLSNTELDTLKNDLKTAFAYKSSTYFKRIYYGSKKCYCLKRLCNLILLFILVLERWEQHSDGTTTGLYNTISREEFTNLVNECRKIIAFNPENE